MQKQKVKLKGEKSRIKTKAVTKEYNCITA